MCKNRLKEEMFQELQKFIDQLEEKKGALIATLHKAQDIFGYIPQEVQEYIGKELDIPVSEVYGVVTFYSYFTMKPRGKYPISVCLGTACFVKGADRVLNDLEKKLGIKVGETTKDGKFSIDVLRCIGACVLAPVVTIGEDVYGKEEALDVEKLLEKYGD